jgi:FPC/CPF motif-containing protein YcgG
MSTLSLPNAWETFRALVGAGGYPCVMAASALRRGEVSLHAYPSFDDASAEALGRDLARFARAPDPGRGVRSFVAVFGGAAPASEAAFEAALWDLLSALHARDSEAWDPAVSADPADPEFSFSFAGRAFYIVGMHPAASRPARRLGQPALVFNLHEQFERLRREGRYDRVRGLIRERDRAWSGSVNPMMEDFGVRSEARQYAGRAVGESWRCPFAADATNGAGAEHGVLLAASYVLPIKARAPQDGDLTAYLRHLARLIDDVVVVDGSASAVFARHARAWGGLARHVRPATETPMGKVGGVLTGLALARHDRVVIADDDVRYSRCGLERLVGLLDRAEVVRPQNVFRVEGGGPLPWHARWDTGRTLLNRLGGGDWPGTLGVRRSALADGYRGDVMFENLELVRTVRAGGGREAVPLDLFVPRRPPTARHFVSQRVRQAYDEWARPGRLAAQLAVLPVAGALAARKRWRLLGAGALAIVVAAEAGRRRGGGRRAFAPMAPLWAPLWVAERAVTSWLAVGARLRGGVGYGGGRLRDAATPLRDLQRRHTNRIRTFPSPPCPVSTPSTLPSGLPTPRQPTTHASHPMPG